MGGHVDKFWILKREVKNIYNNKGADQTVRICRLICFIVHLWQEAGFLMMWLIQINND